ncbi:Polysialic acid transport ATP-binding protein KpsT [Vibrio chagasii]|nr:Polysialic acid transport ATP-binding protein KpsT [Vibrio chagasii]
MIELKNISKHYRGASGRKKHIFRNQSLVIPMDKDVAILGKNGAGKSTLVRLLGGIEKPSSGEIITDMSMSWPLGLGTGVQSKLTGRQNTAFVCSVYGVDNIDEAHEFVCSFSELGSNYDDVVATYSSGMKSRLAFAISIMFKFEVILLDEVLSVGDKRFRKKCEAALTEMRSDGTRVMLVSHSDTSVKKMCQAAIIVDNGNLEYYEDVKVALDIFNSGK